jgi:hypothetical protein
LGACCANDEVAPATEKIRIRIARGFLFIDDYSPLTVIVLCVEIERKRCLERAIYVTPVISLRSPSLCFAADYYYAE